MAVRKHHDTGDLYCFIPDSLQIGNGLGSGNDYPEIIGHRLAAGNQVDHFLIDLHF